MVETPNKTQRKNATGNGSAGVSPAESKDGIKSQHLRQMGGEYMKYFIRLVAFRRRDARAPVSDN